MRHILYTKLAQLRVCDPEERHLPELYSKMLSLVRGLGDVGDSRETALRKILFNILLSRVTSSTTAE